MSSTWTPITDLQQNWQVELVDPQLEALMAAWHEQVDELEQKQHYRDFLVRLRREWAIETGVLERLYSLGEGATKTLIEQGFDASLLGHDDSDTPIHKVLQIIGDQYDVIEGLYQFISGERPLGTSYVKELHQALTAHQDTYEAVDSLGNIVERELPRGVWKLANNQVGDVVCCPWEQVDSEMDRLLVFHRQHAAANVPPYIEAAWIHHRFSIIHPFADGNGRVARCLATIALLKPRWFPLVVTRAERTEYIRSLRAADAGDLSPLVDLFGRLQKLAIRRAMSLAEDVGEEIHHREDVIAALKQKFGRMGAIDREKRDQAIVVGAALHKTALDALKDVRGEVDAAVKQANPSFRVEVRDAPSGSPTSHYNRKQITEYARKADYWVNFQAYQSWVALVVDAGTRFEILISFHGMGHGDSGAYACAAMCFVRETDDKGEAVVSEVTSLAADPFSFTYRETPNLIQRRFQRWVSDCILLGLRHLENVA